MTTSASAGPEARVQAVMDVVRLVDGAVSGRALVLGSAPPGGRDLDLLVDDADAERIRSTFDDSGLVEASGSWALFRGCAVVVVELAHTGTMELPAEEVDALLREGLPVPGATRIVAPSAHHALLILARRLARARALEPKHRERIDRALEADREAWTHARARAASWAAVDPLAHLEGLYRAPPRARETVRSVRWTRVITLSGARPDEARLHAVALHEALFRLGYETALVEAAPHAGTSRAGGLIVGSLRAALELRRRQWALLGHVDVVVHAAHALDHAVALGDGRPQRTKRAAQVLRWVAPRPRRAYVLEHSTESRADAYRAGARALGARAVDADAPTGEVCELIARDAWHALVRRGRLESVARAALARLRRGARGA